MRRLALAGVACAVAVLTLVPAAAAHDRSPFAKGNASAHLLADWWEVGLRAPVTDNPFTGTADQCVRLSRHVLGPVFAGPDPVLTLDCTVPRNTWILAVTFTTECSDAEEPPFFGATPRERRACAIAANQGITTNTVDIDGKTYDVSRYRYQTPDRKVRLPEDDLFEVDADQLRFTADGWAPLIEPLKPGHHVITIVTAGEFPGSGGPVTLTGILNLEVTRR
jgi:hypothetical protein